MMIFGNPKPMPEKRNEFVGCTLKDEFIEIAPGDSYSLCTFTNCEFQGVGPVLFDSCEFVDYDGHNAVQHGHYRFCEFWFIPSEE